MTREEAKNFLFKKIKSYSEKIETNKELVDLIKVDELIDRIYNDFENRVCRNCKYDFCGCAIQDIILNYEDEHGLELSNFNDFGCIKFERKEDEQDNQKNS